MPLQVNSPTRENPTLQIKISGRFDYSLHKEFRDSYTQANPVKEYTIDLSDTEYMDSSALGMLLLLKEHADTSGATVSLYSPTPDVRRVLEIANFNSFFKIS